MNEDLPVKIQSPSAKYYNNRVKNDPVFYANEKIRIATYNVNKYKTDEEYREWKREYMKEYMKEYYQIQKLKKSQNPAK